MVGFRDFDGVGIAPVSNKLAVKGLSINYVVSVGGKGGSSNNDLLNRHYLIKNSQVPLLI